MSNDSEFSTRSLHQLIKGQTGKRVSSDSADLLAEELDGYGERVASKALEFMEEDGRKTVRAADVRQALQVLDR